MAVRTPARTAEELLELPEDGLRRELVDGELRVMAPAGAEHGRVAAAVGALLSAHVRETGSGVTFAAETGFVVTRDPDTVLAPDAAFVNRRSAEDIGATDAYWPAPPDLAVEVKSPRDSQLDLEKKARRWLEAGSVAVLVLDPAARTATTYRRSAASQTHSEDEALDLSDAVPGWRVVVGELFG